MEVTDLRAERDQAQERFSSIASLLSSALNHKRARSKSDPPARSARVSKAARSTSGPFPAGALSQGSASRSSIEVLSAEAAGQKAEGPGGSEGASSSPAASEVGSHSDGGESSSGTSGFTRVFDSDAAGSDSSSPESSRAKNEFGMPSGPLSDAELAALPPTTVPRSEWLPDQHRGDGRKSAVSSFHQADGVVIPLRDPVPPPGEWRDDLVDESNVRDLIESAPWEILAAPIDPLTFKGRGWFRHMMRLYASYEDEHLRAYWDSTHPFR
ncbi:hypothetical protein F443_01238 [Phytophthora nicotianae P1569]|uniref:Uncharacterized protein n=1 Tax=Phytophthora nicotianae P1569 TaxID=1317065 RepID=V9FZF2_PHYNI|nr:hypothetical protein F443_01238 [Phytophthora nicotianae P1569]